MQDKEGEQKNNDGGIVDKCDICWLIRDIQSTSSSKFQDLRNGN